MLLDSVDSVAVALLASGNKPFSENEAELKRWQALREEELRIQKEIAENAWKVRMAAEAEDRRDHQSYLDER